MVGCGHISVKKVKKVFLFDINMTGHHSPLSWLPWGTNNAEKNVESARVADWDRTGYACVCVCALDCVCAGGGNTLRNPSGYRLAAGNRDAGISLDLLPGKCQVGDEERTEGVDESH